MGGGESACRILAHEAHRHGFGRCKNGGEPAMFYQARGAAWGKKIQVQRTASRVEESLAIGAKSTGNEKWNEVN